MRYIVPGKQEVVGANDVINPAGQRRVQDADPGRRQGTQRDA
ncbi:hypothetical protein [Kribbella sp. NPDC049227]